MVQANTRKVLSGVEPGGIINLQLPAHRAVDYSSADLYMKTPKGILKAVEFRPAAQVTAQNSSNSEQRKLYTKALAQYIIEQEEQGNKFFIRQPNGTIQHLSVTTRPDKNQPR